MPNEDEKRDTDGEDQVKEGGKEKDRGDDRDRSVRQRLEALIPDIVRKTIYTGLGAVFTTQEQIREMAGDLPVPKDVVNYLLNSAQNTKDEFFKIVARETREFLERVNLQQEMAKLLTQLSLEVKTEIRFIPNDEAVSGVKPDIKKKVSIKRVREDGTTEEIDPEK
jgi:hypothetical protein